MKNHTENELFVINCTGDIVVGDEVCFERDTFSGSFRNPKFDGTEKVIGKIIKDSYGKDKQQHTFTIELVDGSTIRIKGRNLYRNGTFRKIWADESKRKFQLDEKHERGDAARKDRVARKTYGGIQPSLCDRLSGWKTKTTRVNAENQLQQLENINFLETAFHSGKLIESIPRIMGSINDFKTGEVIACGAGGLMKVIQLTSDNADIDNIRKHITGNSSSSEGLTGHLISSQWFLLQKVE